MQGRTTSFVKGLEQVGHTGEDTHGGRSWRAPHRGHTWRTPHGGHHMEETHGGHHMEDTRGDANSDFYSPSGANNPANFDLLLLFF